jgi:type VI secretion system protein ImpG
VKLTATNAGCRARGRHQRAHGVARRSRNISNVIGSVAPPLAGDLQWRLISHMSLSYSSLATVESLRSILSLYNFQAIYDRQAARENELRLEAIREVTTKPEDTIFRGAPVRGLATTIEMIEANFAGEGDLVLFGNVLDYFLGLYASLNSYSRLTIKGAQSGEIYKWSPRLGQKNIL